MHFFSALAFIVCVTGTNSGTTSTAKPDKYPSKLSGKRPHPVVMGGYAASLEEFPYAFRIYIYSDKVFIFCTGAAIRRRLVITAAHCVYQGGDIIVVTGDADQEDYVQGRHISKYARYRIISVKVHPYFDKVQYLNDVAVLKTGRSMVHQGYNKIRISFEKLYRPSNATIFGWGATDLHEKNNQLYGKHLRVSNCTLTPYPYQVNDYFCLLEKGICHGDSGGGLIINRSLFGVASFYQKQTPGVCGVDDLYYYTALYRVKHFVMDCLSESSGQEKFGLKVVYLLPSCFILHLLK